MSIATEKAAAAAWGNILKTNTLTAMTHNKRAQQCTEATWELLGVLAPEQLPRLGMTQGRQRHLLLSFFNSVDQELHHHFIAVVDAFDPDVHLGCMGGGRGCQPRSCIFHTHFERGPPKIAGALRTCHHCFFFDAYLAGLDAKAVKVIGCGQRLRLDMCLCACRHIFLCEAWKRAEINVNGGYGNLQLLSECL